MEPSPNRKPIKIQRKGQDYENKITTCIDGIHDGCSC